VDEYKGKVQVKLSPAEGVIRRQGVAPPVSAAPEVLSPARVVRALLGHTVRVRGTVAHVQSFPSGVKVVLDEGKASLEIYVKSAVAEDVEDLARLGPGGTVSVRGRVDEYKGRLQLRPQKAEDVRVEAVGSASPPPAAAPEHRKAATLTKADVGKMVILVGTLGELETLPKGTRATLDDGSEKRITVVVWDTVKKRMKDPAVLAAGHRVQVIGKVGIYRDELQVVPEEGWDVISKTE
jgi:DNA/RNA endonuclease YhcR with UshA esterase domain